MKIFFSRLIVLLILLICVTPLRSQILERSVTLPAELYTGKSLIAIIERQQSLRFSFDEKAAAHLEKPVHLAEKKYTVRQILDQVRQQTGLDYTISDDYIILKEIPVKKSSPIAGKGVITGRIFDEENGEPVEGATVHIGSGSAISAADGSFTISLQKGKYVAAISSIGFGAKEVTDIEVNDNAYTELRLTLKRVKGNLQHVVVSVNVNKAGVAALYAQQKNNASITDGISAQQIALTPDNNMGQVLKRVSGISTIDNRYVVVRGLTERYNQGMIDGVVLPSTDMNRRNFSFDVVPAELVSSVVVNKTATPDISAEFSGGQVIINTLDIPSANFTILTLGTGMNTNTTGKDFIQAGGRGKYDFLGFDDGHRKMPYNIKYWFYANQSDLPPDYAIDQSRGVNPDGFRRYHYHAPVNQNDRISLGRVYLLKNDLRLGIIAGLSLRNTSETNDFINARGMIGMIDSIRIRSNGKIYKYTAALGGLLNVGLQGRNFKITLRNLYSGSLRDYFYTSTGQPAEDISQAREQRNLADPEATRVLQNKLEGEHLLGKTGIRFTWSGSVTNVSQQTKDRRKFVYRLSGTDKGVDYFQTPNLMIVTTSDPRFDYRLFTDTKQTDYNWGAGLSRSFRFLNDNSLVKTGYAGWHKKRTLSAVRMDMYTADINALNNSVTGLYEDIMAPDRVGYGYGMAYYGARADFNGPQFTGISDFKAGYLMLDQHFFKRLRLVYGVRGEQFSLTNDQFKAANTPIAQTGERNWKWLPSANLTFSLKSSMNVRAAYSRTLVRPDFRETAVFGMYDPYLEADITGANVKTTNIQNYDLRYEWYPAPGSILSVSAFYKKFDKPIELVPLVDAQLKVLHYAFQNQKNAENKGLEIEFRQSLSFIADRTWLKNIVVSGNAALIASKISELQYDYRYIAVDVPGVKRPLYGQSPWLVNAAIGYNGLQYGLNISYNRSGYRTYIIRQNPGYTEYENGRNLVDLQLYTRLFRQRLELKLNVANLLNAQALYYNNISLYSNATQNGYVKVGGQGSEKYDKQYDNVSYKIKYGSTISLSAAYKF